MRPRLERHRRWRRRISTTRSASCPARRYVSGQYGVEGLYVGVPAVMLGSGGVEKIVEIKLDDEAKGNLQVSVDAVKELIEACKGIDGSLN